MDYLVIDCETSTFQTGNAYSKRNKLCLVGIKTSDKSDYCFDIEYSDHNYAEHIAVIQEIINDAKTLVLFNAKFDLAWLLRYGIDFSHCRIWDCQLVHFILSGQQAVFPSLNQVAECHQLGTKLDIVKEEYWNKGLDTTEVPIEILTDYLVQDLSLTEQVYLKQVELVASAPLSLQRLISLSNQDLLVLLEMESNGIKMNFQGMIYASSTTNEQILTIKENLNDFFRDAPDYCLDYNSGDNLSTLLFGGKIIEPVRTVIGVYKTGAKIGQDRYRVSLVEHVLPRRFEPPRGSNLKKEGFFATNEATLRSIKAQKESRVVLDQLIELSKLEKLNNTYYDGFRTLHETKDWERDYIYGQFNQVVARTGRLSSSAPNLQNLPPEMDNLIETRF